MKKPVLILGAVFACAAHAQTAAGEQNILNWRENLPFYESRCTHVAERIAAISGPNAVQQDAITNAQAWCYILTQVRSAMVTDPALFNNFRFNPAKPEHWTSGAEYFVSAAERNEDPFAGAVIMTRAFRSVMDGHFLFYHVQLPAAYDPEVKYGVDIYFHSGGQVAFFWGNTTTALSGENGWWVKPSANPATSTGRFRMKPSCRGETDFRFLGQAGCDEEIAHFLEHYSVNRDRIVIGGGSAGGAGAMRYTAIRPDLAAAAYNMTGGLTYGGVSNSFWYNQTMQVNFSVVPFLHWYCPPNQEGNYNEQHPSFLYLQEQASLYPGAYDVFDGYDTNAKCSHVKIQDPMLSDGWTWLRSKSINHWPDRVIFTTYGLGAVNQSRWVAIDTTINSRAQSTIHAAVHRALSDSITVTATNIDRLSLDLSKELLPKQEAVRVTINDSAPVTAIVGGVTHFWKSEKSETWSISPVAAPPLPVKKKGISGPIADFFMQVKPLLIVYGTAAGQSPATQEAMVQGILNKIFPVSLKSGRRTLRSQFEGRIKKDVDVNESDAATYNIIVIGSSLENSYAGLLSKTGRGLPITWGSGGTFTVNSSEYRELQTKCSASGPLNDPLGCSYVGIYPNPQNQGNYVLLIPETYNLGPLNSTQITQENCDIFVGHFSGYAIRKAAVVLPQDWGAGQ
ncbi:MAG: hypothetical protein IT161_06580 [Bryobacterales bacterium]|nr:hypothetical protein [Bryobacterales bacterium]